MDGVAGSLFKALYTRQIFNFHVFSSCNTLYNRHMCFPLVVCSTSLPQFQRIQWKTHSLTENNNGKAFKRKSKLILVLVHLFMYLIFNKSLSYQLHCIRFFLLLFIFFTKKNKQTNTESLFSCYVQFHTQPRIPNRVNISIVTFTYTILILQIKQKHNIKRKIFSFSCWTSNLLFSSIKEFLEKI